MKTWLFLLVAFSFFGLITSREAKAAELVVNGSFETGTFAGWTIVDAAGSWNSWQNSPAFFGGGYNPPFQTAPQGGTRDVWNGITSSVPNAQYTMTQDIAIPAGTASMLWKDRIQMNLVDFCSSAPTCGQGFYFVEILDTSNVLLQTLYTVTAPPFVKTDTGWQWHFVNLNAYAGQTIRLRFRDFGTASLGGPGQAEIDVVSIQSPAVYSAAAATIGGRILTAGGRGIQNAVVTVSGNNQPDKTVVTGPFGYYTLSDLEVGQTYIVTVSSKRYQFINPTRIVSLVDNLAGFDFTASP